MPNYRLRKDSVQWNFRQSRAKIQFMAGAYANGKTTALAVKALDIAANYPGCEGLLARATYPKLNDTLRKVFFKWCPKHWIRKMPTKDDNTCYLTNGSCINFRYIAQRGKMNEDGSTTSNLLSATYDFIGIDQVEDPEIEEKDYLDLFGRLRGETRYRPVGDDDETMPATGPRWMMLTSNPTHNWVYRKVVKPLHLYQQHGIIMEELPYDYNLKKPIIELFEGDLYSNVDNLEKDFIQTQETMYKGQMRERYVLGKWSAFEGLVYPTFDTQVHMLTRSDMLRHMNECYASHVKMRVIEGYDFGLSSPSCYLFAFVDHYGRVCILDGFYKPNFPYTEHPTAIREIRGKYAGRLNVSQAIYADPNIFRKQVVAGNSRVGESVGELLGGLGIITRPGMNDIISGIAKVNSYWAGHPNVPHIVTGEMHGPLLYVCEDLGFFRDEIGSYYWKRNPFGQNVDEPVDRDDHAMDTTKYMLSYLPAPSEIKIPKADTKPTWMYWQEEDERYAVRV